MKLTNFNAVLFDLDGTLLDTADDLGATLNHLLQHYGFETVQSQEYRMVASDGVYPLLDLGFKEELVNFDRELLRQQFLQYYEKNIATHTTYFDGVEQLLIELNQQQMPWGVVTNKPGFLTDPLLSQFELFQHSKTNISGDTTAKSKPHPMPMFLASREINVAPEQILYIGDAKRDIEAGHAASMTTGIAKWGYIKDYDELPSWAAHHTLEHPLDILSLTK